MRDMHQLEAEGQRANGPAQAGGVRAGAEVAVLPAASDVRQAFAGGAGRGAGAHEVAGPLLLAIDPGTDVSGWALYDGRRVVDSGVFPNGQMLEEVARCDAGRIAIEMIASYGMPVGREVFETCVWIGRFVQAWHSPQDVRLVYRKDVKLHLCGTPRAKDPNVRQALIDLFPATGGGKVPQIGTKAQPGPLYGVSSHAWPALGVAVTAWEVA